MINEASNIMAVYNQYKQFIFNHLNEISDDEIISSKLFEKYVYEFEFKTLQLSSDKKRELKAIIVQKIKDLAIYNINDENTTQERKHQIILMEQNGDILSSYIFRIIIRQLQLEKRLYKEELTIYIKILENMWNHIGNGYYFKNEESNWQELFSKAIDLYYVTPSSFNTRIDYDIYNIIKAVNYLKRFNIQFEIIAGEIILSDTSHTQIHSKLEELIKSIGGIETLRKLFNKELQHKYKPDIDRYLIHRRKSLMGATKGYKRIPYNYLINICGKFLNNGLMIYTDKGREYVYQEIIDISSQYLSVLHLQGYSLYEDIFVEYNKLPEYIYKNMIFENLYIPIQYKPDFILEILSKLYKPLYEESKCKWFTFDDYYKVTYTILKDYTYCSMIKFEDLRLKLGIRRKILRNILNEISEPKEQINKNYTQILTPTNLFDKPLVKLNKDTYFMISPHFCGYSFCMVIYRMLKDAKVTNLDRKLGELTEDYVKEALNNKNIPFKSGHYSIKRVEEKGECDVVLETEKEIIFLEIKKRSLPETFELGDDVEVLRSLGEGMVKAQKQILNHRVYLQKNKIMKLYEQQSENCPYSVLEWKGRRIVSISMCLPEYGFLTNKTISTQLLESLVFATYHARDPQKETRLKEFNKLRDKIALLTEKLEEENKKDIHKIFFNTLFRSLQQFTYALEISNNIEELIEYLTREIYIIDGSLDFYSSLYFSISNRK